MIIWKCKPFRDLSIHELYDILRLRSEVFVVEQNCVYQDMDNKDQHCYHLCGWKSDKLIAYVRLLPPQLSFDEPSIGRVVTSPLYRGTGAGRSLMKEAIDECIKLFGEQSIRIGAQLYLKKFYESLGFSEISEIYLEDNIPHVEMLYTRGE